MTREVTRRRSASYIQPMGRPRIHDADLPRGWARKHGAIYLRVPAKLAHIGKVGSWIRLGESLREAHLRMAELLAGSAAGTYSQLFTRYREDVLPRKAAKSQREQGRQLDRLEAWCGRLPLGALTPGDIAEYLERRGAKAPVVANREVALLSHCCTKGVSWRLLPSNPCIGVERNDETPDERPPGDLELMRAYLLARPWLRALMGLAYVTGLRPSDVRTLRESDFGREGLRVTPAKTSHGRRPKELLLEWTPALRAARAQALAVRPVSPMARWLVCKSTGREYSARELRRDWSAVQQALRAEGLPGFKFKNLRQRSATDHDTGEHLGHSDKRVLNKHYRNAPTRARPL